LQLPREAVEALLLAVDALQPLLDRLRAQITPIAIDVRRPDPLRDARQPLKRCGEREIRCGSAG
jgi:hypothetical protein